MAWVLIVIVLALLQFQAFGFAVAKARGRFGVAAPATTGHPEFERYFRVQMNTLEQLILFVPAIWLFAQFVDPHWAAGLGAVYLVGRLLYFASYVKDPKSRSLGFALTALPTLIMLAGVLYQAVMLLVRYRV
jgi:glutathione S-transferase